MVKKELCFLLYIHLAFQGIIAQNNSTDFNVGKKLKLNSVILNQEREIQIYLPEDYQTSKEKCPVIYVFDSQKYFLNAVSYQQNLRFQEESPGFIVVGIKTKNNERRKIYNSESYKFSNYIEKELIPYINSNYKTFPYERVFFGWQRAGAFGIELLASKPNLFDGYILSSPYPVSYKMKRLKSFLESNKDLNTFLYFVSDAKEFGVKEGTEELNAYLKENKRNQKQLSFINCYFKNIQNQTGLKID